MIISAEALLVIVLVGLTAGWLAGQILQLLQRAGVGLLVAADRFRSPVLGGIDGKRPLARAPEAGSHVVHAR